MKNNVQMTQQQAPQLIMPIGYDMMGQPIYPQPVPIYVLPQGATLGSPQILVNGAQSTPMQSLHSLQSFPPHAEFHNNSDPRKLASVKSSPALNSYFTMHSDFTPPHSSLSSRTNSSTSLRSLESAQNNNSSSTTLASNSSVPPLSSLSSLQRMTPIRVPSNGSVPRVSSLLSRSVSSASLSTLVRDDGQAKKKSRPNSPVLLSNNSFNSAESIDRSMAIFNITSPVETPLTTPMQSPTLKPTSMSNSSQQIHLPPISSMVRGIAELDEELLHRKLRKSPDVPEKPVLDSPDHTAPPTRPHLTKDNSSGSGILTIENLVNKEAPQTN
ncbi:hypothetical protein OGAPHI_006641 [Ogataea philodendri]|uniref:Uncharacterized protein n=1 Tax=Ogataea philodendri TaxID=1378263 RepID=A0A9P8T0J3_9ASCO|nr:uncharacterized protein OGAPHI_006641 [Ogataea philodendri]KAH3661234.1 hypothetical protein OGAPHI_006641 [Ogataea philodendri]